MLRGGALVAPPCDLVNSSRGLAVFPCTLACGCMGKYTITEEERLRRSEAAKALVQQGKIGGPVFGRMGGKAKAENLHSHVASELRKDENRKAIADRLIGIIKNGADREANHAIRTVMQIDSTEHEMTRREDRELEQLERAELLAFVVEGLQELHASGQLDGEPFIDGDAAVEVRAIGPGEGD